MIPHPQFSMSYTNTHIGSNGSIYIRNDIERRYGFRIFFSSKEKQRLLRGSIKYLSMCVCLFPTFDTHFLSVELEKKVYTILLYLYIHTHTHTHYIRKKKKREERFRHLLKCGRVPRSKTPRVFGSRAIFKKKKKEKKRSEFQKRKRVGKSCKFSVK